MKIGTFWLVRCPVGGEEKLSSFTRNKEKLRRKFPCPALEESQVGSQPKRGKGNMKGCHT